MTLSPKKTGVLLINLGTPDAPNTASVRKFLREFLSDPRVITLPAPLRWILLNGFILIFRPKKTAKAYQAIWQTKGSPLRIESVALKNKMAEVLGSEYDVELSMRYGHQSIEEGIRQLLQRGCSKLIIFPLFPQYASSSSGSAIEEVLRVIKAKKEIPDFRLIHHFYDDVGFIDAHVKRIQAYWQKNQNESELLLFSYHGLPVSHLNQTVCDGQKCGQTNICPIDDAKTQSCYRAQCFTTSHLIAERLGLSKTQYRVAFQSRLGKLPWITPQTDTLLSELAAEGVKKITVVCPSFVTDCLETLEEINIRAREQWKKLGGESFHTIPCLNSDSRWVSAACELVMSQKY